MTFAELGQQVIQLQGQAIVNGTVLAGVTWLLCATVFKKARPALHAALWTVVLIRFLVPPVLPGEISLSGLLHWLQPLTQTAGLTESAMVAVETAVAKTVPDSGSIVFTGRSESASWAAKLGPGWLGWLYGFFLLVVGSRCCWRSYRVWRQMQSLPPAEPKVAKEVRQLAAEMGLQHAPNVRTVGRTVSPCVMGLWRPTLVVPSGILEEFTTEARKALLLHELAHIKRGDLLVRGLENLARVLFFFWPPVWWVCKRIECFSEMACDQWALSRSRIEPQLYARSLLKVVKGVAVPPAVSIELAFAHKGRILEERFEMILRNKKMPPTLSWLMMPALAVWASFALAGGSQPETQGTERVKEKRVEKVILVAKEGGELPIRLLEKFPEADLDGNGALTHSELKQYLDQHPELGENGVFTWRSEHQGSFDEREFHVIKLVDAEVLYQHHPEDDPNGDGELDRQEITALMPQVVGAKRGLLHIMVQRLHAEGGHREDGDGEPMQALDRLLQRRALDGDGKLTGPELQEFLETAEGMTGIRITGADKREDAPRILVELKADGLVKETSSSGPPKPDDQSGEKLHRLIWKTIDGETILLTVVAPEEQLDLNRDGQVDAAEIRVSVEDRINIRTQGDDFFLGPQMREISEAEAIAKGETLARHRRQQLLQKYPQADLDGNGEIDADEAKALAAKLQTAKVRVESVKKPNQ